MRNFFVFLCLLLSCPDLSGATDLSESQSRSIKNSLDKVLKEVKSKLEFFFNRKDQRSDKLKSRLIKTPIETILPEAWLEDDRDFLLPSIPTDVEIHIEDINRREWQKGNWISDKEEETFPYPRKTRFRKKQKLKTRFQNQEDRDKTESKIYFTEIIRKRPRGEVPAKDNKKVSALNTSNEQEQADLLDKYSPFIYAELLKENETSFAVLEDLTGEDSTHNESVAIKKLDVYSDEPLEMSENIVEVDDDMVTLEVAMVDTIVYKNNTSDNTSHGFLPFIPPSGIDFEAEYELGGPPGSEADNGTDLSEDLITLMTDSDPFRVTLKKSRWSFPCLVVSGSLLSLLVCYECSVIFSLLPGLPASSHCLVLSLCLSLLTCLLLTTEPTPLLCAATRLLTPLSYTLVFSCLLVKFSFLTFLSSSLFLSTSYQARDHLWNNYHCFIPHNKSPFNENLSLHFLTY